MRECVVGATSKTLYHAPYKGNVRYGTKGVDSRDTWCELVSWTNIFRSRYVKFLEAELASVRQKHIEETQTLKNTHAEELNRAIVEANRGWAEADRLRQYLIPGLATSTRVTEAADSTPNKESAEESGTPFQRISKRIMMEDEARYNREEAARKAQTFLTPKVSAPVIPAQGEN